MILREWLFGRKPNRIAVMVNTSKRKPTDYDRLRTEMCQKLAAEIGYSWPPQGKAVR